MNPGDVESDQSVYSRSVVRACPFIYMATVILRKKDHHQTAPRGILLFASGVLKFHTKLLYILESFITNYSMAWCTPHGGGVGMGGGSGLKFPRSSI